MTDPTSLESLRQLGLQRRESNLPRFLAALQHQDGPHRALAARAISWLRKPLFGRHLHPLTEDLDAEVRLAAVAGLAVLKDPDAGPPLIRALTGDGSPTVRSAAARALGWLTLAEGAPALMNQLAADHDAEVRAQSARALGRLQWVPALKLVVEAGKDPAPTVRQASVSALSALVSGLDPSNAISDSILVTLRGGLSDTDAETRALTLRALASAGTPDALEHCIAGLQDPNPGVRVTAAVALRRLENRSALPHLSALKDDPHPEVAQQITETISALKGPRSCGGEQ